MSNFKYLLISIFAVCGLANAAEFSYQYTVRNGVLLGGVLKYQHINMLYANEYHKFLTLSFEFLTNRTGKYRVWFEDPINGNALAMMDLKFDNLFVQKLIEWASAKSKPDEKAEPDHGVKKLSTKEIIKNLPPTKEKELQIRDWMIYVQGRELLQEMGVQIEPQPWYRRYFYHILGFVGLGAASYLYLKHGQKGASK